MQISYAKFNKVVYGKKGWKYRTYQIKQNYLILIQN